MLTLVCFLLIFFLRDLLGTIFLWSLIYAAQQVSNDLIVCCFIEIVQEEERGRLLIILFLFYCTGSLMNGLLFKYFSWESILLFYFIVPIAVSFVGLRWYIRETPFDLVTSFAPEEAHRELQWIAEQNGKAESHAITVEEVRRMREEYEENLRRKEKADFHFLDLLRFPSLRTNTVYCCLLHFFIYYNFSAPLLAVDQFTADVYLNEVIFSLASIIMCVLCYFFLDGLPRIKTTVCCTLLSCIFILPVYFASNCQ